MANPQDIASALEQRFNGDRRRAFQFLSGTVRAYWTAGVKSGLLDNGRPAVNWDAYTQECARVFERCSSHYSPTGDEAGALLRLCQPGGATRKFYTSPGFIKENDKLFAISRRTSEGTYIAGRPRIIDILQYTCQEMMPELLMADLYRIGLRRHYGIYDDVKFLDFALAWFAAYNSYSRDIADIETLIRLVTPATVITERWALGLIELLDAAEIIRASSGTNDFSLQHLADPSYLFPRLFGVSTGNQGLDYLFYSGLWVPKPQDYISAGERKPNSDLDWDRRERLSMVIRGEPGMGKTTLALSLAATAAARGGLALYFRFELDARTLTRQLHQFHRRLTPFFSVIDELQYDAHDQPIIPALTHGVITFQKLGCGTGDLAAFKGWLDDKAREWSIFAELATAKCGLLEERLVVFDTMNAVVGYGTDPTTSRSLLRDVTNRLHDMGYVVVYLVEGHRAAFDDHFVDVDIGLGDYSDARHDDVFRLISIKKTRWQASHRGMHVYHINAEQGLSVHPSSIAVLTSRRRRASRHMLAREWNENESEPKHPNAEDHRNTMIDPGIVSFAKFFGSSGPVSHSNGDNGSRVPWWKRGSVTTIVGPRGSFKSSIAFAFAARQEPVAASSVTASSLLLRFSEANAISLPHGRFVAELARAYARITEYPLELKDGKDGKRGRLVDILIRSGHIAPGDVLDVVRTVLRDKRAEQTPIRRAVIQAVGNIEADYPTIAADRAFIPALREIFGSEGVTLLLVCSAPESAEFHSSLSDQLFGMSDNIIRLASHEAHTRTLTAIFVERSSEASHNRGTFELRKQPKEQGGLLEVVPSFELFDHPRSKLGEPADVDINLIVETRAQMEYATQMSQRYFDITGYSTSTTWNGWRAEPPVRPCTQDRTRRLQIRMVDASVLGRDRAHTALEPLRLDAKFARQFGCLSFPGGEVPDTHNAYSVPFSGDPSFLVARRSFCDYVSSISTWAKLADGNGEYSWQQLIDATSSYCQVKGYDPDNRFDAGICSPEGAPCLFLEVMLAEALQRKHASDVNDALARVFLSRDDKPSLCSMDDLLCDVVLILSELLNGKGIAHRVATSGSVHDGAAEQRGCGIATTQAVLSRHWYSTYREMAAFLGQGEEQSESELRLLRLPSNVWTNGDWHLGISSGSIGIGEGTRIIFEDFLSNEACLERYCAGFGLPLDTRLYREGVDVNAGAPLIWFAPYINNERVIVRSAVDGYRIARPLVKELVQALALKRGRPSQQSVADLVVNFQSALRVWVNRDAVPVAGQRSPENASHLPRP